MAHRYNLRLALLALSILAGLALEKGQDHRLAKALAPAAAPTVVPAASPDRAT